MAVREAFSIFDGISNDVIDRTIYLNDYQPPKLPPLCRFK